MYEQTKICHIFYISNQVIFKIFSTNLTANIQKQAIHEGDEPPTPTDAKPSARVLELSSGERANPYASFM
jgi:hypothetical protein